MLYAGGCHCGAVRFEVEAPERVECLECNCSICAMTGYLHLIVPRSQFRLLSDPVALTTYRFNTGVAQHTFCKVCGIKSFYVQRSNPDGYSVNVRCLDPHSGDVIVRPFDGQRWELNAASLRHLSEG